MKLNVGCGLDVRDGWVNLDPAVPFVAPPDDGPLSILGDARDLSRWWGQCEIVLLSHVLHLFTYDDAELVLDQCAQCLAPGGRLVIVDADVLNACVDFSGLMERDFQGQRERRAAILSLVADDVEPTAEGKLLRWITWHSTRRSLWSVESLDERLAARGLRPVHYAYDWQQWLGAREAESFVVAARKP